MATASVSSQGCSCVRGHQPTCRPSAPMTPGLWHGAGLSWRASTRLHPLGTTKPSWLRTQQGTRPAIRRHPCVATSLSLPGARRAAQHGTTQLLQHVACFLRSSRVVTHACTCVLDLLTAEGGPPLSATGVLLRSAGVQSCQPALCKGSACGLWLARAPQLATLHPQLPQAHPCAHISPHPTKLFQS